MRLSDEQFKQEVLERKKEALAERRHRIRLTVSLMSVSVCTVAAALLFGPLIQEKMTADSVSEEQYSILLEDFIDTENDNGISSSVITDDAVKSEITSTKGNTTVSSSTVSENSKGDTAKGGLTVGSNRNEDAATDANLNFATFFGNLDFRTATCDCPTEYTVTTEKGEYRINLTTACVRFGDLSASLSKSEYATLSKLLKGE